MSLSLALNTALSGLQVNQRTMALISNNIANANTEGYSRQTYDLSSVEVEGVGQGVRIEGVTRKVDKYLQDSIYRQTGNVGYSESIHEYYESMQILLGDPALGNSIDEHIEIFFNDLQQMAETPELSSSRAAVVESAVILAREISNLAEGMEELRFQADNEIDDAIQTINLKLEELYFTNEAIGEAYAFGAPTATLLDKRDLLLEDIAEYIDINVKEHDNGTVDVYAGDGISLVNYGYSFLEYRPLSNPDTLIDDGEIAPIIVQNIDGSGESIGLPVNIASGGTSSQIEKRFTGGRLAGLMDIRDNIIPNMLEQMDELAAKLRDSFNEIHNQGSGYPAASELVGTALYDVSERSQWTGSLTIAALNEDGTPVSSVYNDELSDFRPMTLDLSSLYSGKAFGEVDMQTIIDEINHHFGVPQNRMSVGNLNNVELALVSNTVPGGSPPIIEFDFDIENISANNADFWVENIQVLDDGAVDITSTTNTMPSLALSTGSTFTTIGGSPTVTVTTALNHSLSNGDMVRLYNPGGPVNGIPAADFDNYFVISNVTANSFEITVATPAGGPGPVGVAGQTTSPAYETILAGQKDRLQQDGTIRADLSGNPASNYYDVNVDIVTRDVTTGVLSTTTVTYRILNDQTDTMNDRVAARAILAGTGTITAPSNLAPILRASLVDEDGNELENTAGYYGDQQGYLKIESMRDGVTFAMSDVSSEHQGLLSDVPPRAGDGRGFSHHYGLNNFFSNNLLTETGDTLKNSALNMAVENRLRENPSLISTGDLQLSNQPSSGPLYTYERFSGDQSVAQALAGLGLSAQSFRAAGGLPSSNLSFNSYAGEMLGYISAGAIAAQRSAENEETLLGSYIERADAISGVNLDEELANTIIYQNAYSATARIISVTDELFETLLGAF